MTKKNAPVGQENKCVDHDLGTASFYVESLSVALDSPEIDRPYCQELVRALGLRLQSASENLPLGARVGDQEGEARRE